jgi:hypothetical protein
VAVTPRPGGAIQRALAPDRLQRLETHLGSSKFGKVKDADGLEIFDRLSDGQLDTYQRMDDHAFDAVMKKIRQSSWLGDLAEKGTFLAQFADAGGALLETGQASAQLLQTVDGWLEGIGGGVGGVKDMWEGFRALKSQPKTSWLTMLGGASSLGGLFGLPEVFGMAAGGAKALAGVGKAGNTWMIRSEINRIKAESNCSQQMKDALDMLYNSVGYLDPLKQSAQGAMEGGGSLFGTWGKWGGQAVSKSLDLGPMAYRFVGSWWKPGQVQSNTQKWAEEKQEKERNKDLIRAAVMATPEGDFKLVARLYKVCEQVDGDFAKEVTRCVDALGGTFRQKFDEELRKLT